MTLQSLYKKTTYLILISVNLVAQDPIISVWYIGTRVAGGGPYNHYIELFNPTEDPINLSQYALVKGHGQSNNVEQQVGWGNTLSNSGVSFNRLPSFILFPGQSYGISRDVSHESLQNHADLILEDEGVLSISGDDAVGLFKGEGNLDAVLAATDSTPVDCIGSPYEDPGQSWQVSGVIGPANSTNTTGYGVTRFAILTRKPEVCYGNAGNWNDSRGCVTDSCTNWLTDTPQTSYQESEWDVHACFYPDVDGNTGPGYEPETNPNCDEDILVMESFTNTCDLSENQIPISNAGPDQTISYNQVVTLDGSSSTDSDGTIISYFWSQITGPSVELNSPSEQITTFTSPSAEGDIVIRLLVLDDQSASDTDTVIVSIVNTNNNPIAVAGEDQIVSINESVTLDGSLSTDSDGIISSYLWSQISGQVVTLNTENEAITTFTAPTQEDILVFELLVSDELGGTSNDTISVLVQNTTASIDGEFFPNEVRLVGNYPNPFNPKTEIVFDVTGGFEVGFSIYNVYGQEVWRKNLGKLERGLHRILWGGKDIQGKPVVSGVYFYRVFYGDKSLIRKMSLVK